MLREGPPSAGSSRLTGFCDGQCLLLQLLEVDGVQPVHHHLREIGPGLFSKSGTQKLKLSSFLWIVYLKSDGPGLVILLGL